MRVDGPLGRDVGSFAATEGPALLRFAFMLTGEREQAEDLVQDVLVQLSRKGTRDLDNPKAYARRAIVNAHTSLGRRATVRLRALASARVTQVVVSADAAEDVVERDAVRNALRHLSSRQRAAVILRYYEDLSDEAIGQILGCASGTVRSLISRSLPRLRDELLAGDDRCSSGGSDD